MNSHDHKLWYAQPANDWHAALPIGNGHLGVMVFGDPVNDRLQVNEESIWAGPPYPYTPDGAREAIDRARELIFNKRYFEANQLIAEKALSPRIAPRSQQPLGDVFVSFHYPAKAGEVTGFRRELDLGTAVASANWSRDGVRYTSEVFCGTKTNTLVARYRADKPGQMNLSIQLRRECGAVTRCVAEDTLFIEGTASQRGRHRGVKFAGVLKVVTVGGQVLHDTDTLNVTDADEVRLYLSVATDYHYARPTEPLTDCLTDVAGSRVRIAAQTHYDTLLQQHIEDHLALFGRVNLKFDSPDTQHQPLDARIRAYQQGAEDKALEALQFHYGRYLLVTSSRPDCLPANLQGVWNDLMEAPWNADYHININIQMNYWAALPVNLAECQEAFFTFIERLLPGAKEAASKLGCRGAYSAHTTDIWLWSTIFGSPGYGMWVMGYAWCVQHFMEHVRFTGDVGFARERALPLLRECCLFFLDWLVTDPHTGKLVSGPSTSPENTFVTEPGVSAISMGCAMDQQIIWDTFTNYLECLDLTNQKDELRSDVEQALAKLRLPGVGSDGRLMEWSEELVEKFPGHRHVSHLFALHPGRQYTHEDTPDLVAAAKKSLDYRLSHGGGHTGWSRTWLINFRARLREGDAAHDDIRAFIGKLTVANLFCTHPPFQIDGNFGYVAGVTEMLLQSHQRKYGKPWVHVLPALPGAWPKGEVNGLRARGGMELGFNWEDGRVVTLTLTATRNVDFILRVNGEDRPLTLKAGETYRL
ncbi:MAG: hypothetical protein GC164_03885 [Phycisphaera sp.]|nr:hypothetical protein [Phycisphaera sp.]